MLAGNPGERIIIIAPFGQDAVAITTSLAEHGFQAEICEPQATDCREMAETGALVLTEEALELSFIPALLETLKAQPPWSELPLIILTSGSESRMTRALNLAATAAGSITLLERPIGIATLVRSVDVALRSRRRQYQVRDLLRDKARLAAIVENSEDAIISKDLNGVITSWNNGAERLFGYAASEAIGGPITMLIPPEHLAEEPGILDRIRHGIRIEHYETVRRRKDGVLINISLTVSPLTDSTGKIVGASKIARDISHRKQGEQQLRESEERYRSLVEQVKDYAIFRMDKEGRPTSWNEGVQRVLGFEEGEFIGRDITKIIFTPEDVAAHVPEKELQTAAEKGTAGNDRWMRHKDGTRFFATGVTTGLRNEAGEHIGFTKVLRDESARKQAEDALAEAQTNLREYAANLEKAVAQRTLDLRTTNEQLEAFVYSIAHDLRTPLRSMIGFSQLLIEDYAPSLDTDAQHHLQRIQASAEFMDKLLLDLLAYGRTARAEVQLESVKVARAWDTALFQCAAQIEQSNATVGTIGSFPVVRAHEATLGQVLANLLSNALKFVPSGVKPHIRFWSEEQGDTARLWLEDNGIGIAPEQRERVFRVFERLHGARYPGTGVGLSIVRKGIERMGGQVGLESELGKGTRFWIELPKAT